MSILLETTFRDVEPTDAMHALVREQTDLLGRFCDHVTSCRVAIEQPQRHQRSGNPYRVRIDVTVPRGHELVVSREPKHNEMHAALDTVVLGAFKAMRRQLRELVERQRGDVKTHAEPHAFVVRLFRDAGYGFLETLENREVYFHRNTVGDGDFDDLEIGAEVRFEETKGEMGPQATTVKRTADRRAAEEHGATAIAGPGKLA